MNKDTLVLKDGTVVELETGASLSAIGVLSPDKSTMVAVWDKLTDDNLSKVVIKNGDGLIVGRYADLVLVSETSVVQPDGSVLTSFCLREKTDMEKLEERVAAVEEGQIVQDGAIMDQAEVINMLAEAQEVNL